MKNILRLIITLILMITIVFKMITSGFDLVYAIALGLLCISLILFIIAIRKREKHEK